MKTSNVLASALFGSLVAAAPLMNKRDLVTKTELVVETVVVFTTVWEGETPVAEATSTPGLFYENHHSSQPASQKAQATSTAAYTPPAVQSSSVYTPPASSAPAVTPSPTPTPTPAAQPSSVYTPPAVESSSAAAAPSSVNTPSPVSSAAPAATSSTSSGSGSGTTYSGDVTVYDNTGAAGACGKSLTDDMMIVALAQPAYGASTYDVATGNPTNPWCGKTITIEMNGNQIQAQIEDMCPGCSGHDIDLSRAAFNKLTGTTGESTRYHDIKWWVSS